MAEIERIETREPFDGICFYCRVRDATLLRRVVLSREKLNEASLNPRYRTKIAEMPICGSCLRKIATINALGASLAICGVIVWGVEYVWFYKGDLLTVIMALAGGGLVLAGGLLAFQNIVIDGQAKETYQTCAETAPAHLPRTVEAIH